MNSVVPNPCETKPYHNSPRPGTLRSGTHCMGTDILRNHPFVDLFRPSTPNRLVCETLFVGNCCVQLMLDGNEHNKVEQELFYLWSFASLCLEQGEIFFPFFLLLFIKFRHFKEKKTIHPKKSLRSVLHQAIQLSKSHTITFNSLKPAKSCIILDDLLKFKTTFLLVVEMLTSWNFSGL